MLRVTGPNGQPWITDNELPGRLYDTLTVTSSYSNTFTVSVTPGKTLWVTHNCSGGMEVGSGVIGANQISLYASGSGVAIFHWGER